MLQMEIGFQFYMHYGSLMIHELKNGVVLYADAVFHFRFNLEATIYIHVEAIFQFHLLLQTGFQYFMDFTFQIATVSENEVDKTMPYRL